MADDYKPLVPAGWDLPPLSGKEMKSITDNFRPHKAGVPKFAPLLCEGPNCQYASECVLVQQGIQPPIGRQCFVEANLIHAWMQGMAESLEDKGEDLDQFDRAAIGALAINQVMMKRALSLLAREPMVVASFRAMTPDGDPIFENKKNPALDILKEFTKLNQSIQQDLMVTRREKSKDAARKILSPTEAAERLKKKMAAVKAGLSEGQKTLVEHRKAMESAQIIDVEVKESAHGNLSRDEGNEGLRRKEEDPKEEPQEDEPEEGEEVLIRDPNTGFLIRKE